MQMQANFTAITKSIFYDFYQLFLSLTSLALLLLLGFDFLSQFLLETKESSIKLHGTEINISVLGYILLYWCIFYCTGRYTRTANEDVCVLRYRMQQYNRYLCIAVVGHRKHVPSQMRRQLQELAKDFTSHGKQFSLLCSEIMGNHQDVFRNYTLQFTHITVNCKL